MPAALRKGPAEHGSTTKPQRHKEFILSLNPNFLGPFVP
jgi:hypothetical protein